MAGEPTLISRRKFYKTALGSLAFGGCVGLLRVEADTGALFGDYDPISKFLQLGLKFGSPEEVAATFVRADSSFLMASYAVFFPELIRRHGFDAVEKLEEATKK